MLPMEFALWSSSKKLEIGFEIDIWPAQLVPYILFWMHNITSHMNGNRVAYLSPFTPMDHKGDALTYNKVIYGQKNDRSRHSIVMSYIDYGRLALMKANLVILRLLDKAGAMKQFMTDKEIELTYDAKIYNPFSDFFFFKRQRYNEAKEEIEEQLKSLGDTVDIALLRMLKN